IATPAQLEKLVEDLSGSDILTVRLGGERDRPREPPTWVSLVTPSGAAVIRIGEPLSASAVWKELRPVIEGSRIGTHGSKNALLRLWAAGVHPAGVAMDTEVAAYLLDPARGSYGLDELSRQYLDRELRLETGDEGGQQALLLEERADSSALGLEAVASAELSTVLEKELRDQ